MASSHFKPQSVQGNPLSKGRSKTTQPKSGSTKATSGTSPRDRKKPLLGRKLTPTPLPRARVISVWVIFMAAILGLGYKLYQLQIIQGASLQKKARSQQTTNLQPYIPRRSIIDGLGNVLAADSLMFTLYAHPKLFKLTKPEMAEKLALILNDQTPDQLVKRFEKQKSGIKLAIKLSESQANKITDLKLDGLELEQQYARLYPQDDMAAEVVGYADNDRHGQAGIELSQQSLLERNALSLYIRRSGQGTILPAFLPQDLLQSNDWQVKLTLDMRLQRAARESLKEQLKAFKAKKGTVMIMDAMDGSILAMVNEPTFNPNQYSKAKVELFKNWAVSDLYEPGSTLKPVNVAIALNAKAITPQTTVYDGGSVRVGPWTISNADKSGGGNINVSSIIQHSSNVGMVGLMRHLKPDDYYTRLQEVGLDSKTGIDLPGEVASYLKPRAEFVNQPIEPATTSFGQGLSLTPVKLLQLNAALANGGKLITPHLVSGLVDSGGTLHWKPNYPVKTIFTPQDSYRVVQMMENVVSKGTAKAAQIKGYRIGGKTGTAQKASASGGYMATAKITSFVAILPVEKPRYVVLAVVDEAQGGNVFGGTVAAPIVKKVMEALIAIKGIPPSSGANINYLEPTREDKPEAPKNAH